MNISVGRGRFIQRRGDKYVIATICGHVWNFACECYDAQYRVIREFDSYDDALNWCYGRGKYAANRDECGSKEIEREQEDAAAVARSLGR